MKFAGMLVLVVCLSSLAMGAGVAAPEVGPGSAMGALVLLAGAVLVIRGRRKK